MLNLVPTLWVGLFLQIRKGTNCRASGTYAFSQYFFCTDFVGIFSNPHQHCELVNMNWNVRATPREKRAARLWARNQSMHDTTGSRA